MTLEDAFGEVIRDDLPQALKLPTAIAAWYAVDRHPDFAFIETRRQNGPYGYSETLCVECRNDEVPSRNRVGIFYREPLGLTFYDTDRLPEIYALRSDFPLTLHQNASPKPDYKNPCLYFEPWSALRRTWTPQKYLRRILWWFAETANGTLHRPDQPVEQLYFRSPVQFVVPSNFSDCFAGETHELVVEGRKVINRSKLTLLGRIVPAGGPRDQGGKYACIPISISPIVHGPIEPMPQTLGELHDQLQRRGGTLVQPLSQMIKACCIERRYPDSRAEATMLVLNLPLKRDVDGDVERTDVHGFVAQVAPAELGVALGALERVELQGRLGCWAVELIGVEPQAKDDWRKFAITPVEVVHSFSSAMGRDASGITTEGPIGVFAGAGALGSEILDRWFRSGWGRWTVIDPDHVQPHNLARHRAFERHVGFDKALVMTTMAADLTPTESPHHTAIVDSATNLDNSDIVSALEQATLVVDVTTTLEFPRDLASNPKAGRAVSAFITPSGRAAVMLLEDAERTIRLDSLEAQYYRGIISAPWGQDHLAGNRGHLWTGAGCRDLSAVLPNEYVGVHAGNLASMIRRHSVAAQALIMIWQYDPVAGSLTVNELAPAPTLKASRGVYEIVWDGYVQAKVRALRRERFPNETGGILLGYFDRVLSHVYIVDALSAPADSKEEPDGFIRGIRGLEESVNLARQRTGRIVDYVGEWHSHPAGHPSDPSGEDLLLLRHLAVRLSEDGQIALMLIVGEEGERWLTAFEIVPAPE